jgi:hypothetical protein
MVGSACVRHDPRGPITARSCRCSGAAGDVSARQRHRAVGRRPGSRYLDILLWVAVTSLGTATRCDRGDHPPELDPVARQQLSSPKRTPPPRARSTRETPAGRDRGRGSGVHLQLRAPRLTRRR